MKTNSAHWLLVLFVTTGPNNLLLLLGSSLNTMGNQGLVAKYFTSYIFAEVPPYVVRMASVTVFAKAGVAQNISRIFELYVSGVDDVYAVRVVLVVALRYVI